MDAAPGHVKILQIHNLYREPGGEDAVADLEAELLREAGHEVITHRTRNPDDDRAALMSLAVAPWNPRSKRRVRELVTANRPDVVHFHNTWFELSAAAFAAASDVGVPVVATVHNYRYACANALLYRDGAPCELCVGTHAAAAVRHRCYRGSVPASMLSAATIEITKRRRTWIRHIDLILTLTGFARSRLEKAGIPSDMLRVKPNVVRDKGRRSTPPSASHQVVIVGRMSPEKGARLALEAWRSFADDRFELVIVGDGPELDDLRALEVPGVSFTGRLGRDEVDALMRSARALLFPSTWYEAQPMVLLEAFAAGLPVVANDLGSMTDMLSATPEWLVGSPTPAAWAERLSLLGDDAAVDRAGAAVRATYDRSHRDDTAAASLAEMYELASRRALAPGPQR